MSFTDRQLKKFLLVNSGYNLATICHKVVTLKRYFQKFTNNQITYF